LFFADHNSTKNLLHFPLTLLTVNALVLSQFCVRDVMRDVLYLQAELIASWWV